MFAQAGETQLEASDRPTLITTGAAREYTERRFEKHAGHFDTLLELWQRHLQSRLDVETLDSALQTMEAQDDLFPNVEPTHWRQRQL